MELETKLITRYRTILERVEEIHVPFETLEQSFDCCNDLDFYAAVANSVIEDKSKEHSIYLYLSADRSVIGVEIGEIGSETACSVSPEHAARTALMLNSKNVIHCHNHPQHTKLEASLGDYAAETQLRASLSNFGILLVESMIINDTGEYISYPQKESGPKDGNDEMGMLGTDDREEIVMANSSMLKRVFMLLLKIFIAAGSILFAANYSVKMLVTLVIDYSYNNYLTTIVFFGSVYTVYSLFKFFVEHLEELVYWLMYQAQNKLKR